MATRQTKLLKYILILAGLLFLVFYPKNQLLWRGSQSFGSILYQVNFLDFLAGQIHLKQDDPNLISYIKKHFLLRPKKLSNQKQSTAKQEQGQYDQAAIIDKYLKGKRSGFFIEAGAWDGVYLSNSLFFEEERNWSGILVEPNREAFKNLTECGKRSSSWAINACLSTKNYPEKVVFAAADVFGGIIDEEEGVPYDLINARNSLPEWMRKNYRLQCFPLYSIIVAATGSEHPVVDYMSLDVEGSELAILKTIPWSQVDIRTISVEVNHSNVTAIEELLLSNGYKIYTRIENVDIIFVKE